MCESNTSIHCLGKDCDWDYLWNWLGDREVYFCGEKYDMMSGNKEKMFECFNILHYVDGVVFWKLRANPSKLGVSDVMGSFLDANLNEDEIGVFMTHDSNGDEIDVIEQWKTVGIEWWKSNKDSGNIRALANKYHH